MAPKIRKEASFNTPKTRTKAIQSQSKGKSKIKDEESSNKALKDIDWKLIRAFQSYQKEQEEDYGLNDALPLLEEILVETFPSKFKLSSLDKYDSWSQKLSIHL